MADEEETAKKASAKKAPAKAPAKRARKNPPSKSREVSGTPFGPEDLADEDVVSPDEEPAVPDRVTATTDMVSEEDISAALNELPAHVRNKLTPGTLTVHYRGRHVNFAMDGDTAIRLLTVLAGTSRDMDPIRPDRSDARAGWLVVDTTEVIGAQWTPEAATVPRRATMDPAAGLVDIAATG